MQKEETMLQKRFVELANIAWQRGIVTCSDFLNLNELNILHTIPKNTLSCGYKTFGGYAYSERQMAAFLPDAFCCDYNYPIRAVRIRPSAKKFAEELTHRDYLGAILNLGMERSKLGDILVVDDGAIVFAEQKMAPFICENLTRIRHTTVTVTEEDVSDISYTPKLEEIAGTVASVRLDTLLALAFGSSRSKLVALIEGGKVFVNGRLMTTNSYQIKEGDIVSVRGMGRFQYEGIRSQTKKGRYYVAIQKYVS